MNKILKYITILVFLLILVVFSINFYVVASTKSSFVTDYKNLGDVDCIIILGAGVRDGNPSPMLEDRLLKGIELYKNGVSGKIIMSGDHGRKDYDEVNVMKKYAIEKGVASSDIFMDHAGFSTYETMYRAKEVFKAKKVVIVTQQYHLYRALYIAKNLGLEAYGVNSDQRRYAGQFYRDIREVLARNKDFVKCIFKPFPTYMGDEIPISGNGDITNDK